MEVVTREVRRVLVEIFGYGSSRKSGFRGFQPISTLFFCRGSDLAPLLGSRNTIRAFVDVVKASKDGASRNFHAICNAVAENFLHDGKTEAHSLQLLEKRFFWIPLPCRVAES